MTPDQDESELKGIAAGLLQVPPSEIHSLRIVSKGVDARRDVRLIYQVEITCTDEEGLCRKWRDRTDLSVRKVQRPAAAAPFAARSRLARRPVVVGFGPAGIFAALILARAGAEPIVLERGAPLPERVREVTAFWSTGSFLPESNACFGEGGAGAFSDGKLRTRKRSPAIPWFLRELVDAGAPSEILYDVRPHIGTDRLPGVIVALREKIEAAGGEVRFRSRVTDILVHKGRVSGVQVNAGEEILTDTVILSPGHGAGDTFEWLLGRGVRMEPKPLAMGVRVEHPQEVIDRCQYGRWAGHARLGPADYRLTYRDRARQRGVYSFCMCPGGRVIAANPEKGAVVTNGMSAYARDSGYANSGLVVTVRPEDFWDTGPLSGLAFLRESERHAYRMGGGNYFAPAQRVTDFLKNRTSSTLPEVTYRPGVLSSNLKTLLPDFVTGGLARGLEAWGRKMPGFVSEEAVLIAVETRTSSPVRILRGRDFCSINTQGLYPAGEGAGYAGGIVSSALDGVECACAILQDKGAARHECKI